jgi:hypothetical protein
LFGAQRADINADFHGRGTRQHRRRADARRALPKAEAVVVGDVETSGTARPLIVICARISGVPLLMVAPRRNGTDRVARAIIISSFQDTARHE